MTQIIFRALQDSSDCQRISRAFKSQGWDKPVLLYEKYLEEHQQASRDSILALFVNDRASLGATMVYLPISLCADSRQAFERPVVSTRASIEEHLRCGEHHAVRAADYGLFALKPIHLTHHATGGFGPDGDAGITG